MAAPPAPRSRLTAWLAVLLALATVFLALALACDHFQAGLDSDVLWPQVFAHDLGDSLHPTRGWTFGSAAFWFPDFALFLPLKWLCGESGLNYPLYTVVIFVLIGATMAWSLAATGLERASAAMAGFLAVDVVLLTQFLPGHGGWLWLLGMPGYHGASLPVGLSLVALVLGAVRAGKWKFGRLFATCLLLALSLASDNLLLVHWVGPLILALAWTSRRSASLRKILWPFTGAAVGAVCFALVMKFIFVRAQWFFFQPLFVYAPTPDNMWKSFSHFAANFILDGVFTQHWLLWLLAAAALTLAWREQRSDSATENNLLKVIALRTGLLGLVAGLAAPIAAVYWIDPHSLRYLPNWAVVPAWLIALAAGSTSAFARWRTGFAIFISGAGLLLSLPRITSDKLFLPRPPEEFQAFCAAHGFTQGLADYWHAHLLMAESRFAGPRLGEIANGYYPVFWCNNAFDYFPTSLDGRSLSPPAPQFVILDGLDPAQLAAWLHDNKLQVAQVGPYHIAVLTPEQSQRAGEQIAAQAKLYLQGTRTRWLESHLGPTQPPPH